MRIFLLSLMLVPALAAAGPAPDANQMKTDDCARARKQNKTCVIDMGKEEVEGGVPTAHGTSVAVIQTTKQPSLITLRKDFIVEILKSAEDL